MINQFTTLTSTAIPLKIENVDTDQIIPARFLKATTRKGSANNCFSTGGMMLRETRKQISS